LIIPQGVSPLKPVPEVCVPRISVLLRFQVFKFLSDYLGSRPFNFGSFLVRYFLPPLLFAQDLPCKARCGASEFFWPPVFFLFLAVAFRPPQVGSLHFFLLLLPFLTSFPFFSLLPFVGVRRFFSPLLSFLFFPFRFPIP